MYKKLKFKLARYSFEYVLKTLNIKEINLPYYLCDVIRHMAFENGVRIKFYHIRDDFMPDKEFEDDEFILYPNYFGVCENNSIKMETMYPNLILDNAHSLLSKPRGIASFDAEHKFNLKKEGSNLYIKTDDNESGFEVKKDQSRIKNFKYLHEKYAGLNLLNFDFESLISPFCYPCLAESGKIADDIVNELTTQGYTIYRYWNNLPKNFNEYKFYRRLVPIPLINKNEAQ